MSITRIYGFYGEEILPTQLITLCENTAGKPGFVSEWGLSIFIKTDDASILFDTGAFNAAVRNADKLNINLQTIDCIVLSHAHADHTGGMCDVLARTHEIDVIAHPSIWEAKYTKRPYETHHAFIGIPFKRQLLELYGANFILTKKPHQIRENIWTSGEIPQKMDFESIEPIFFVKSDDEYLPDSIPDDLALFIKMPTGLIVILGCSHRGLVNTIYHAQEITGEDRVHTIVGGTHLFPKTEQQRAKTIEALNSVGIQNIGVSHCTGFEASRMLSNTFGNRFFLNNAGTIFEIE